MSERGPQGERGERGPGLSRATRRAIVFLFFLAVALAVAALFVINQQRNAEQAAQQRQGLMIEQKLCTTFGRLAALKPPPGNPHTNPSRAYEQGEHAILAQVGPDIGCTKEHHERH